MNRLVLASLMVVTIVLGTAASGVPARNDDLRLSSLQVAITFDGMPTAYFRSVSGLKVEIEVVEFREGGSNDVRKLPGQVKYPNLVLKQGFSGVSELQKWAFRAQERHDRHLRPAAARSRDLHDHQRVASEMGGPRLRREQERDRDRDARDRT